jgi:DNA-binding winged helix-turn-helix (wHTH) protein/Flp pilus assembly protein TadD
VTDSAHIRFDGWVLERASGELTRGGQTQRLPPQPLAALIELADHAGEVITRERLARVLWPRGIVDFDNSLNAVARKLRVTLGDDSETPRYIETLPRIGYRFIGKIESAPEATGAARTTAAAGASPAHTPAPTRSKIPWISRGPLLLAAALVVVGLVAWLAPGSDSLTRSRPITLVAPPDGPSEPKRTTNERAYDLYLQGIFNRSRRDDTRATDLSAANFEEALKLDPYYADAWAALAETLSGSAMTMHTPVVPTYERAKTAALRAVELDESLGHAHAALAHIYTMFDRDFARAEAEIARAQALDPGYARNWHTLALLRAFQGRMPEALDAMRRARELESTAPLYNGNYGLLLYEARRYDESIAYAKLLLATQPRFDQVRSFLIRALVAKGDIASALEQLPLRITERPTVSDAGFVYAHAGRAAEARAEIERIERLGKEGYGVSYDVAMIQTALGDLDAACGSLRRALDDHSLRILWMRLDPAFDPLREQPCYAEVASRLYGKMKMGTGTN